MDQGDFTQLAKSYINRPGYALDTLREAAACAEAGLDDPVRDVGAGTGKLTENLLELGYRDLVAVEPNDGMRGEGERLFPGINWIKGSAEDTGLPEESAQWILMGSSFHWTDAKRSLPEFQRVLKPGGAFTALWNPRNLEASPLQLEIDDMIRRAVPHLKRKSSGSASYTEGLADTLAGSGCFREVVFHEGLFEVAMEKERYMGAWRSVNDIQAQAGADVFEQIMDNIERMIAGEEKVIMPYRTRAWTARVIK